MVRIRRCWPPAPFRPMVNNGYERKFVYVYGAVSPKQGSLDWMICPEMNAARMGRFLRKVSRAHPNEFIIMVVDGASSHKAKGLIVPENIRLLGLPAYSPELNPQEHVWLDAVTIQLKRGLKRLTWDSRSLQSLTNWSWINSLILKAN